MLQNGCSSSCRAAAVFPLESHTPAQYQKGQVLPLTMARSSFCCFSLASFSCSRRCLANSGSSICSEMVSSPPNSHLFTHVARYSFRALCSSRRFSPRVAADWAEAWASGGSGIGRGRSPPCRSARSTSRTPPRNRCIGRCYLLPSTKLLQFGFGWPGW